MLSIKEWNLDSIMFTYLWSPFKWLGKQFQFLQGKLFIGVLAIAGLVLTFIGYTSGSSNSVLNEFVPIILMSIALAVILFAFAYRRSALRAWVYLLTAHFFIIAAVIFNTTHINLIMVMCMNKTPPDFCLWWQRWVCWVFQ